MQGLQRLRVDGQVVKGETESGTGGIVATKDENEGLGKNLVLSQTYEKTPKINHNLRHFGIEVTSMISQLSEQLPIIFCRLTSASATN